MKKSRLLKSKFENVEFKTLAQLKNTVYKQINYQALNNPEKELPIIISKKELNKLFNKKTISKSKLKKYSYLKAYKKTFNFLEKNTKLEPSKLKKLSARISNAALLKNQQKLIFDTWEFKDNKIFIQNYKNILKINQIIEKNNYDIFRNTRIITNNYGQRFTFRELIAPTKKYINKIRSNLISVDADLLSYFANKRNLKKLEKVLTARFQKETERGRMNSFNFDFTTIDFRKSKEEIISQVNEVEANYYDKTGKYEIVYTRYFKWKKDYYGSDNYTIFDFSIKDDNALWDLSSNMDVYILYDNITSDLFLADEYVAKSFIGVMHNDYSIGANWFEFEWEQLKQDMINAWLLIKRHLQMVRGK